MSVALRLVTQSDFSDVRRITRDAYLRAGHFSVDHPYMSVPEDVEHSAEHAQAWVAEGRREGCGRGGVDVRGGAVQRVRKVRGAGVPVDPACRGNCLGRAVMVTVRELARRN